MWRLPLVGGNWNNSSNAGLAYLNLNNLRSNVNNNIGFRPALRDCINQYPYGDVAIASTKRSRNPSRKGKHEQNRAASRDLPNVAIFANKRFFVHTTNNIWKNVIDYESLYLAYKKASKGKRYAYESMKFRVNLEENLITIQNDLIWKTYKPEPLRCFTIYEPKQREIAAPSFRDRVVHHALVAAIEPIFEKKFVTDSFACRKGRGTHAARYRIQRFCRITKKNWGKYWILKADIKKFFPSVSHSTLKRVVRRTISDRQVLWLIDLIIDSYCDDIGIPIGALTSQLFANIYLDQLDHYMKDELGVRFYVRYMDDACILGRSKEELKIVLDKMRRYVATMKLELNHKTAISPGYKGVDMCGYRIWPSHVKPRKRTVKKVKSDLRGISKGYPAKEAFVRARIRIVSFLGYMKHCSGHKTTMAVSRRAAYSNRKGGQYGNNREVFERARSKAV